MLKLYLFNASVQFTLDYFDQLRFQLPFETTLLFSLLYSGHGKKIKNLQNVVKTDVCPICSEEHNKLEAHMKVHTKINIGCTAGQARLFQQYKDKLDMVILSTLSSIRFLMFCFVFSFKHSSSISLIPSWSKKIALGQMQNPLGNIFSAFVQCLLFVA
jgi:hypothetical protein